MHAVTSEEQARIVADLTMERDDWEALARDRLATLEKLQADRSYETLRAAGRLMQFAWILMLVMVLFAGVILVAGAVRATASCAKQPLLEKP